jgi:PAS domain S-box-containing protein
VADFLGAGLEAGEAAVVIATEPHLAELETLLAARGIDVGSARSAGHYVELEALGTLSELMRNGMPDPSRFAAVVGGALQRAMGGVRPRVRAFGEMVALLCADDDVEAAIRLEELWSDLARELPLSVRCAYPVAAFGRSADFEPFAKICNEHSRVLPAESYSSRVGIDEQLREIARLQQRAGVLEAQLEIGRGVQESMARLAAIVGSSDDAIVSKTLDGIVTTWNASAERIFGFSAQEMIGKPILDIIPPERRGEFETILGTIRRGERVEHFETERIRKDGRRIHVSVTVSPIRDATGRITGASKIARDVTERRRFEAEREQLLALAQRACAQAEAASSIKDEFLATLSHELRNPLAAVRSAVVAARLGTRNPEHALDIACRHSEQLSQLVDDLLDVSRITQGRVSINRQRIALKEILERAADTARFLIEERGHTLRLALPPDSVRLEGDPVRLQQIVVNLLTNAAKYTDRGGLIELLGERLENEAVIRVRDNGAGIAPDVLPRVFDLFVQGHRPATSTPGGLGIGLAVVRSLVTLHGGRVEAHSEGLGKGAEFAVYLPSLAPFTSASRRRAGDPRRRQPGCCRGSDAAAGSLRSPRESRRRRLRGVNGRPCGRPGRHARGHRPARDGRV